MHHLPPLSFTHRLQTAGRKCTPAAARRGIYHANCIGCHTKDAAAGKKTGPLDGECRSCHNAQPQIAAVRLDAGFNLASHYRHIASKAIPAYQNYKDNCGRCHHQYDPKTKKTFYAQGKEDGCRDCHLAKEEKDVGSLEEADHRQCILCHLDLAKRGRRITSPSTAPAVTGRRPRPWMPKRIRIGWPRSRIKKCRGSKGDSRMRS